MAEKHYLEMEFEALMRDPSMLAFLDNSVTDGIWFWDLEKPEHEWMSAGFWRTLGFDPSSRAHLAREWQDLIYPEDGAAALAQAQMHFADPDAYPYDQNVRYRTADGGTVTVRCRGKAIFRDGAPVRMLGVHTVIGDTRKSGLDSQLVGLLELSDDAVLAWSVKNGIKRWNRGAERLYGIPASAAIGLDPNVLTQAQFDVPWTEILERLKGGRQWEGEVLRKSYEGRPLHTSTRIVAAETGQDDVILLQVDRDQTDDVERSAVAELSLEAGRMGFFELNSVTGEWYSDRRDHELMGLEPGRVTHVEQMAAIIHPADLPRLGEIQEVVERSDTPYNAEYRIIMPDGRIRWLAVRARITARDDDGTVLQMRGVRWDVTERVAQQEQMRLLNQELNHRVKNLFSVMQSLVSLGSRSSADVQAMAATLRGRISALAQAHRIGTTTEEQAPVDMHEVLDHLLAPFRSNKPMLELSGPQINLANRNLTPIALILHELATNAVKHGAWARPDGLIRLNWKWIDMPPAPGGRAVEVVWAEETGRDDLDIGSAGLGHRLLDASARQLGQPPQVEVKGSTLLFKFVLIPGM